MHHYYEDILSRITEPPTWWDSNGVPRYGAFTPRSSPNIYAKEVVLLQIRCQSCHHEFDVELHMDLLDQAQAWQHARSVADSLVESSHMIGLVAPNPKRDNFLENHTLAAWIRSGQIHYHYGDPPRHDDTNHCAAGQSMNCEDIRVVEYWKKDGSEWVRDSALEIMLPNSEE